MSVDLSDMKAGTVVEVPSGRIYEVVIPGNCARDVTPSNWVDKRKTPQDDKDKGNKKKKEKNPVVRATIFTFGEIAEREGLADITALREKICVPTLSDEVHM